MAGLVALLVVASGCAPDPTAAPTPSPAAAEPRPTPPTEIEAFVDAFMDARIEQDTDLAETFLSREAAEQFAEAEAGLALTDPTYGSWERTSLEAIDATSFEVQVTILTDPGDSFVEFLFVGWGMDLEGQERDLVVRGAMRQMAE